MTASIETRLAQLEAQVAELVARAAAEEQRRSRAVKMRLLLLAVVVAFYALYLKQLGSLF